MMTNLLPCRVLSSFGIKRPCVKIVVFVADNIDSFGRNKKKKKEKNF